MVRWSGDQVVRWSGGQVVRWGDPYEPGQKPLWQTKVSKVKHFLEGSGHQNFMNPFVYGK